MELIINSGEEPVVHRSVLFFIRDVQMSLFYTFFSNKFVNHECNFGQNKTEKGPPVTPVIFLVASVLQFRHSQMTAEAADARNRSKRAAMTNTECSSESRSLARG